VRKLIYHIRCLVGLGKGGGEGEGEGGSGTWRRDPGRGIRGLLVLRRCRRQVRSGAEIGGSVSGLQGCRGERLGSVDVRLPFLITRNLYGARCDVQKAVFMDILSSWQMLDPGHGHCPLPWSNRDIVRWGKCASWCFGN
jgi:hypothetical protein